MQFQNFAKLFRVSVGLTTFTKAQPTVVDSLVPYLSVGGVRHKRGKIINKASRSIPGGVPYFGFTYFPRFPDKPDPPYEPSKLFAIRRIASLVNRPYWEKHMVLVHLKLAKKRDVAIVKNTPIMNAMLYKVKHLIEIKPIQFPNGLPTDVNHGFLDEHGIFTTKKLLDVDPIKAQEDYKQLLEKEVDPPTLKLRLHNKWYSRW